MTKITFTVDGDPAFATPLTTSADIGTTTVSDILDAYRSTPMPMNYYKVKDTGKKDATGNPVTQPLTDAETIGVIVSEIFQNILGRVTGHKREQALNAVQLPPSATFKIL